MALRIGITNIGNLTDKNIFLDTNIWLHIFCPLTQSKSRNKKVQEYTKAFFSLIKSRNKLYTDISVLSEFINRYQRIAFKVYSANNNKGNNFDYKQNYTKTIDFKKTTSLIISTIKNKILKYATITNFNYTDVDMIELVADLDKRRIDFTDLHIEKICKKNQFILLTDDGDYIGTRIDIISGNQKLINNSSG